jgi:hypothetical protein
MEVLGSVGNSAPGGASHRGGKKVAPITLIQREGLQDIHSKRLG